MDKYLVIPLEPLKTISINEILVLSQIIYMKKAFKEIYPSNAYLSKKLSLSVSSVQRAIAKLVQNHYITFIVKHNNKRYIKITIQAKKVFGIHKNKNIDPNKVIINNQALNTFYKMLDNN